MPAVLSQPLQTIAQLFSTHPHLGALEITHAAVRYLAISGTKNVVQASVTLPPGIVERGRVKDFSLLVGALKQLHEQIVSLSISLPVVLVLPSQTVYAQSFSVPYLEGKALDEAIDLNLQMLSPLRIEETYYDWQEIKKNPELQHIDLLGAFVQSQIALEYASALKEAGFNVSATEFPGLSLGRLIKERWESLEEEHRYLVIYLNTEGALMMILKNGNLYFNHFIPWYEVMKSEETDNLTFDRVQTFLIQEIQRVLNFYLSRSGTNLKEAILIAPMFNFEIAQIVEQKFSLIARNLVIPELPNLSAVWFPTLGAALRGLLPRSKDTGISLSEASAKTEYYREKTLAFISLWRNVVVATLVFVFLSFLTVDIAVSRNEEHLSESNLQDVSQTGEISALRAQAQQFNARVQFVQSAKNNEEMWSPLFSRFSALVSKDITLERMYLDAANTTVLIIGKGVNELAAITLKNQLEKDPGVQSVSLPLSAIRTEGNGQVNFTITVTLKPTP